MKKKFLQKYKFPTMFGLLVLVFVCSAVTYNLVVNADVILPKKMENEVISGDFDYNKINIGFIDERQQYGRVVVTYTYPEGFLSDKKWSTVYQYSDDDGQHYCNTGNCSVNLYDSSDSNKWFYLEEAENRRVCNNGICVQTYYINNLMAYSDIDIQIALVVWTGDKTDENSTYKEYKRLEHKTFSSLEDVTIELKILNPYFGEGKLCETKVALLTADEKAQVYEQVPYCKRQYNGYLLSADSIKASLDAAIEYVTRKPSNTKTLDLSVAKKIDNLSDIISLSCDPFSDNKNESKYYTVTTTNYPSDSNVVCSTVCTELVTVIYGPPKAVKAGTCFDNEVTVKSSVVCEADIKKSPPEEPNISNLTPPRIECNSYRNFTDQGGPDEEFDSCINSCDGGEYSQGCIDECYQNVYGEDEDKEDNYVDDMNLYKDKFSSLTKINNTNSSCPNIDPESSSFNVIDYNDLATKVYEYYQSNIGGQYNNSGSTITWGKLDNCYWSNYASYYFTTKKKTLRTVSGDYKVQNLLGTPSSVSTGKNKCGAFGYNYCWDSKVSGYYYAAFDGFKKQSNKNGGLACNDSCRFVGNYTNATLNVEDLVGKYEQELAEYQAAVEACTANAVCSNDTATFKVNVDTTDSEDDDNPKTGVMSACTSTVNSMSSNALKSSTCFSWYGEHKQDSVNATGDVNIFEKLDGNCIGGANTNDDYFTTVDFPGTWINNKNGIIVFKEPDEEIFYKEYDNQFCIDRSFKNINSHWWNWHELNRTDEVKNNIKKESLFYNTLTNIREFGAFKWNFDVSCFFATDYTPCVGDSCNKCIGEECKQDEVQVDNFNTRAASLETLFIARSNSDVSLKLSNKNKKLTLMDVADEKSEELLTAGRTTGYNWSVLATDLSLNNYTIAPTAAIAMIQHMGDGVYQNEKELDYSITLTPKQIREIRNQNKDDGFVLNGSYVDDITSGTNAANGIKFYKSEFLNQYSTVNVRPKQYGCNNLFDGLCNDSYKGYITDYVKIDGLNIEK